MNEHDFLASSGPSTSAILLWTLDQDCGFPPRSYLVGTWEIFQHAHASVPQQTGQSENLDPPTFFLEESSEVFSTMFSVSFSSTLFLCKQF